MARIGSKSPPSGGLVLGRYRLEEAIGAGAYGTVWRATDERLDRVVAVKAIPADFAGERAEREIRAAARLSHPGVVTLHEAESDDTHTYLVSEFVRGVTLQRLYADGCASDRDVARIGAALTAALDHAHRHGVVHRDVKPGNVLIPDAPRSEAGIVKLADFGIARLAGDSTITSTGDVLGTLAYMSPEQAAGEEVGPESDLWSLAVVIHEGFSGRNPVRGRNPAETARRLAAGEADLLHEVRPDLPEELVDTIDAALEPDPFDRCTVEELGDALTEAIAALDDEPGTIAPAVHRRERGFRSRSSVQPAIRIPFDGDDSDEPTVARLGLPGSAPHHDATVPAAARAASVSEARGPSRPPWLMRLVGAAAAACAASLWSLELSPPGVMHSTPLWSIAGGVALAVLVLPRIGWLTAVGAALIAEVASGNSGTAVILGAALLPAAPLLWNAPHWWSMPTLAPLLGAPGFAGSWPAVSSFAPTPWQRAAASAVGAWQLACAQLLLDRSLVGDSVTGGSSAWQSSADLAVSSGLVPLMQSRLPLLAAVWAAAAVLLPYAVAGRNPWTDALGGAVWAAATSTATIALAGGFTRGVVAGTLAGAALAVARQGFGTRRSPAGSAPEPPTIGARLGQVR